MQDMAFSIIVVFNLHSLGFSPQLLFAEVLGSELLLLRFFFSSFLGVVLNQELSFFPALFEFGFQSGTGAGCHMPVCDVDVVAVFFNDFFCSSRFFTMSVLLCAIFEATDLIVRRSARSQAACCDDVSQF